MKDVILILVLTFSIINLVIAMVVLYMIHKIEKALTNSEFFSRDMGIRILEKVYQLLQKNFFNSGDVDDDQKNIKA